MAAGALAALVAGSTVVAAQGADPAIPTVATDAGLPFAVGERLSYRVTNGKLGTIGRGVLSVEGPVDVRGTPTYLLRSEINARVGFIKATDRTESWLDPQRMSALRYRKRERRAFGGSDERVELFPEERRWEELEGKRGETPTDAPLDELSFIYYIRTLPLTAETTLCVVRHYDPARNPVELRIVGRDTVATAAGRFATIVVEMRVKDRGHYDGEGTIRLYVSDDARRLPVRIESAVPLLGATVLTLEAYAAPAGGAAPTLAHHPD